MINMSGTRDSSKVDVASDSIRSEHAALSALAVRLEALLASYAEVSPERDDGSVVHELLAEFRRRLFAHLEAEEEGRVLERAAAAAPHLHKRAEALRLEHGGIRASMDSIVAEIPTQQWRGLHEAFAAFRLVLYEHEQAENEILQSAYLDDIGSSG